MTTVNQLRQQFLSFFEGKDHQRVASSPLVPHNDPTLMFTNAGMVPFKDVFTGNETRDYKRATSSQKCVRAGGKHNDLDNVGYTARHHTFFEMLGNFSFGDYFKEEAIAYAWEFLTKTIELPVEKLLVTVYHDDDVAFDLWKKLTGFSDDKIVRIATKDNFWAMGDTGPCGPCSEIFYDHGEQVAGGKPGTPEEDGDRFIEIWNLVFMQYEQMDADTRRNLPSPSIDTGMGLERLAAVLQGVHDNYDIDLFQKLIGASKELSKNADASHHNSHRVIADHLRSCSFLLADGVMPSNEGRGYVLRRIMRRAMRHAHQLGCKEPLMHLLVPSLVTEMGEAYPELGRAQGLITEMLKLEEEKFKQTLDRGLKLLEEEKASLNTGDALSGEVAFKLYDTYGFPLDLTTDILRNEHIAVDDSGFDKAMAEQKARARAAWKGSGEQATEEVWFEVQEQSGATEFLGYSTSSALGEVVALVHDGKQVEKASSGQEVAIILNQTPFYGESGGQEGDTGSLMNDKIAFNVSDTVKKVGNLHVHLGKLERGSVQCGDTLIATIDEQRRSTLKANHSATHILHAVLREVLGDHVTQKGSLVAEDRLRFDISHPKAVTTEELVEIEHKVNAIIMQNSPVGTRLMTPDDAIETGALALFGEKYGDEVRVVNMGLENTSDYSVELCGGTHVSQTGDIGLFKIIGESAIAAGIRRIEAMTGLQALSFMNHREKQLQDVADSLKVTPDELVVRVMTLQQERKKLEKELSQARKALAMGGNGSDANDQEEINGVAFIGKTFDAMPPKDLRSLATDLQKKIGSGVVAVASNFEGKASLIVSVSDDLTTTVNAVDLVKSATNTLGAKGAGGKPSFAQTGGSEGAKIDDAITCIKQAL